MSLIKSIAELRNFVMFDRNTNFDTLKPFIAEAEELFIKDLLAQEFYQEFSAAYEAPEELDEDLSALLPFLQRTLAYYTLYLAIPQLSVSLGELGVRSMRGDESDPAPRWQIEKLQFNALRNGDIHADKLLSFLEANATAIKYKKWYESYANTRNSGYLVYSTVIASGHIDINESRRVFLKLRPKMREIEKQIVPKLIGQAQYDSLVTKIKGDSLEQLDQNLIDLIVPIVCKRALFMQLQFMRVQITENGIFVYSGTDDLYKLGQLASDLDIKTLKAQLMDGELGYLSNERTLTQFIDDNIEDYPLIKASTVYTVQPDPGPTFVPKNNLNNKHFIA